MKIRVVSSILALVVLCAITAMAADISGKWVAQIPGRDGTPQEQVFMFKVAGGTLTGTISGGRGDQEISSGTVSGDDVSFVVIRKTQNGERKEMYKGKIAGGEIKFTRTREGGGGGAATPTEFVAKKSS
jgi:hypothetical protein